MTQTTAMTKRIVSGILLLDKAQGLSSHTALSRVKRLYMSDTLDSKKAGHTGTLDPMATGLLPVCLGQATKFTQFGLDADKGYQATICLGKQTDTADQDGTVIATQDVPMFNQEQLDNIATALTGEQLQIPPMYSALKKDGQKLYELARQGVEVERTARPIVIHTLTLQKLSDNEICLTACCSKGTYVRTLGETVAQKLGTLGHLTALRRTQTGGFDIAQAISEQALADLILQERLNALLPIDAMISHIPILTVDNGEADRLKLGQRLNVKDRLTADMQGMVRLYHDDVFIGLGGLALTGRLQPKKLI